MLEEWRTVKAHAGYEASAAGEIRNKKTKRILRPFPSQGWSGVYYKVNLGDKKRNQYVHRLVAYAFGKGAGPVVDHADRDRGNNRVNNLEAVSVMENTARRDGRGDAWEPEGGSLDFEPGNFQ